jgi:hypothetical protein
MMSVLGVATRYLNAAELSHLAGEILEAPGRAEAGQQVDQDVACGRTVPNRGKCSR